MTSQRKADTERVKRREIYVNDETWKGIKAAAKQGDMSVSRYLVQCHESDAPRGNLGHLIAFIETLQCIDQDLRDIAFALGEGDRRQIVLTLFKLVEIERHLRAIGESLKS
ncbi:hypothetical protein [Celeribacter halophilus]|uniref:hypothetical protein n=1 Tax=Celeribacter halophilus TaxID=576117 RepID=UPI000834D337|nr:hypothetical protein [Celeribacter halophilus]